LSKETDPALYESEFERIKGDRYFTHPTVTQAMIHGLEDLGLFNGNTIVYEPAAGRGDMVREFRNLGLAVHASDVDMAEFDMALCVDEPSGCAIKDFLDNDSEPLELAGKFDPAKANAILTNPPYMDNKAEWFVRRALQQEHIQTVAMVLRSEFKHASTRVDLFTKQPYCAEIVLTARPRWDWWFREKVKSGPRHNFTILCWDRSWTQRPTQLFADKKGDIYDRSRVLH
jgi:hypothetical protein